MISSSGYVSFGVGSVWMATSSVAMVQGQHTADQEYTGGLIIRSSVPLLDHHHQYPFNSNHNKKNIMSSDVHDEKTVSSTKKIWDIAHNDSGGGGGGVGFGGGGEKRKQHQQAEAIADACLQKVMYVSCWGQS